MTPAKPRNISLSKSRLEIEELLFGLPPDASMTTTEIANETGIEVMRLKSFLFSMRNDGQIVNLNTRGGMGRWRAKREEPVKEAIAMHRNSSQPNGDAAYWSSNHAAAMGAPRNTGVSA